MRKAIIVGAGLGGLATALRLANAGYKVVILEKFSKPGGRLNQLNLDGFKFDLGPSFMSMTYEFDELFESIQKTNPLKLRELDPLYQVFFEGREKPFIIYKDLEKLENEFYGIEPDMALKAERFLQKAGEFYNDTIDKVVRSNFDGKLSYLLRLMQVPIKHLPYLFKTVWSVADKTFTSPEAKALFSLPAFFLGSTPFQTPAIYTLLNYVEMKHNGYWSVEGGMYNIVESIIEMLYNMGVPIYCNTEVMDVKYSDDTIDYVTDSLGRKWEADVFVINGDAAFFRGKALKRPEYSEEKLDKMDWTLAPFTIYMGVKGKTEKLAHHNYFLGNNFKGYADKIFTSSIIPQKPYYYVNVSSKSYPECAPEGCENVFILCPVPDLRYKKDWSDKEEIARNILEDLSGRTGFDFNKNCMTMKILSPEDWEKNFSLYRGSGLGLAHGLNQVGAFRPNNKDEHLKNLYYVGASTTPGTGLPMVIISSKLTTQRIMQDDRSIPQNQLQDQ